VTFAQSGFSFCAVLPFSPKAIHKALPLDRAPVRAGIAPSVRPSGHSAADCESRLMNSPKPRPNFIPTARNDRLASPLAAISEAGDEPGFVLDTVLALG
jgi:hypothetical protein